jgi:hypothetical protein
MRLQLTPVAAGGDPLAAVFCPLWQNPLYMAEYWLSSSRRPPSVVNRDTHVQRNTTAVELLWGRL